MKVAIIGSGISGVTAAKSFIQNNYEVSMFDSSDFEIEYKNKVSFLPIYFNMFYAGPKEAAHHALIRQNLGFKYFIVGRDHAGAENLYKPNHAINLLKKNKQSFKIKILTIKGAYYCKKCEKVLIKDQCKHKNLINISGTSFRKSLKQKVLFDYADKNLQKYIHRYNIKAY